VLTDPPCISVCLVQDMRIVALSVIGSIFHVCVAVVMFLVTVSFMFVGLIIGWFTPSRNTGTFLNSTTPSSPPASFVRHTEE